MFDNALIGVQHRIPLSTNFKILNHLSASASTTYTETWSFTTFNQRYDQSLNQGNGGIARDTVSGFDSFRTYNFNMSLGTTLYGTFNVGDKDSRIQKIRHVVRPSISYNINPGFEQYYDQYVVPVTADPEINQEIVQYSRFENTLFGAPGNRFSSNIGIGMSLSLIHISEPTRR